MSGNGGSPINIDFQVDKKNLYREETITDLKIASIQKLTPVFSDGSEDTSRNTFFVGSTQLGTPHGPVPIQARLEAATLDQAMDAFPQAMEAETKKVIQQFKKMEAEQKKPSDSRIIMPGMQ
ncbi:MAG: cytoplasmic protein [Desulfotignum sp.]|nr:cytoplasmic protein [Desulfotignum sp.]MCF8113812.1 cytoplasmic protein [Desulfotignum sp.]MCF8126401.1 cytoplasmic protein [Desulfotignum sp.]